MYSIIIVGGGIIGLASGLRLKEANPKLKIAILEKEPEIASHQTGHNSGVIHSGLYYKPGSRKAKNCAEGYAELIAFCEQEEIPFERCGKIVVATAESQLEALDELLARGKKNGLTGIRTLENLAELQEYEPHVTGIKGLFVPQTGIVDYKTVAAKYAEKFMHFGGEIFTGNEVKKVIRSTDKLLTVQTNHRSLNTRFLVHCAGLHSDCVARLSKLKVNYRIIPFRGEYYRLKKEKEHLVRNLIYPVPNPNFPFLGVHFTRTINGEVEAGPNAVLAYKREGYKKTDIHFGEFFGSVFYPGFRKVAAKYWRTGLEELYRSYSKNAFTKALRQLLPDIQKNDLIPREAGVRAQACDRDGGLIDDFLIIDNDRILHVGNAPSPAATSSLSIGKTVAQMVIDRLS